MAESEKRPDHSLFLTFSLGEQLYGAPIERISEINSVTDITAVPKVPPLVKGVMNLRGKVVPIVDLRIKFGMRLSPITKRSCIIMIDTSSGFIGGLVDSVSAVVAFDAESIEAPSAFNDAQANKAILGIGKLNESVVILLDLGAAFSKEQFHSTLGARQDESLRLQSANIHDQGHPPIA